jgi:hypothetical protein
MIYFFPIVERFPKHEKFTLQTQVKNSVYTLLRLTIEIQKSKQKAKFLYDFDKELEFLKTLIVFSNEKKPAYLSVQSRKTAMEKVIEIGRIAGGMIKKYGA